MSTESGDWSGIHAAGVDLRKVFSASRGDWGVLTFQWYLTGISDLERHGPMFQAESDVRLLPRVVSFNYTGLNRRGAFNLKVGHFETPFGLDGAISTPGTLRQLGWTRNLGTKVGWGVSANGRVRRYSYEVAWMRGSGYRFHSTNSGGMVAGRLGIRLKPHLEVGLSLMQGSQVKGNTAVERRRFAIDLRNETGPFGLLAEISGGRDDRNFQLNGFWELNWLTPMESTRFYVQNRILNQENPAGGTSVSLTGGVRHEIDTHWAISVQADQELSSPNGKTPDRQVAAQLRYRF